MTGLPVPDAQHPPLHNLLACTNPSPYGLDWWLCPPACRYRAWGELHSPRRPTGEASR